MYLKFEFEQRAAVLRESPLFKSCPPSLESFICVSLRPMNVSSQELLVEEGSAIPGVFCIARFVLIQFDIPILYIWYIRISIGIYIVH